MLFRIFYSFIYAFNILYKKIELMISNNFFKKVLSFAFILIKASSKKFEKLFHYIETTKNSAQLVLLNYVSKYFSIIPSDFS